LSRKRGSPKELFELRSSNFAEDVRTPLKQAARSDDTERLRRSAPVVRARESFPKKDFLGGEIKWIILT
jgi:hypothetical protein